MCRKRSAKVMLRMKMSKYCRFIRDSFAANTTVVPLLKSSVFIVFLHGFTNFAAS